MGKADKSSQNNQSKSKAKKEANSGVIKLYLILYNLAQTLG